MRRKHLCASPSFIKGDDWEAGFVTLSAEKPGDRGTFLLPLVPLAPSRYLLQPHQPVEEACRLLGCEAQILGGPLSQGAAELSFVQVGVEAALGQQFSMGAALYDLATVHNQDKVGCQDGAQAVGDHNAGAASHNAF